MDESSKFYKLPTKSIPGLDYSYHLADLVEFRDFLKSRGISTQNTRIERYIQYLNAFLSDGFPDASHIFKNSSDERFKSHTDWLLYVLREAHELMWILRGFRKHIPNGIDGRLEQLIGGTDFAALDSNSHSRNVQFELRIASYFCQAGCVVDLSTDTDIIAFNGDFAFFLECKRVASASQLHHRLSDATKQLKRRLPRDYQTRIAYGIVALDVTKVAFAHNGLTWAITPEHSMDINQEKLKSTANLISRAFDSSGPKNFIKCWLQIHIPCLISNPPTTISRFSSYYLEKCDSRGKCLAALKFLRTVDVMGKIPDDRESPAQKLKLRTHLSLPAGNAFQLVDMDIVRGLLLNKRVEGINEKDVIAKLEFKGIEHEFLMMDLLYFLTNSTSSDKEDMLKGDMESRLGLVLKMFMFRYPYENISTPGFIPPSPNREGQDKGGLNKKTNI